MRIVIVGLGLIGGSLGLALRGRAKRLGVDLSPATREAALAAGAVEQAYESFAQVPVTPEDLVVLCLHPKQSVDMLLEIATGLPRGVVVTDVCGIKQPICDAARRGMPQGVHFIGGHPMAGKEKGGFENASATLFQGARYLLTPPADAPEEAMERVRAMIAPLGCQIIETDPETHDRMIAYTSQMMHILALAICEQESLLPSLGFEGGSFAGATRVAALDEDLWMQLFWPNRDQLLAQVEELQSKLGEAASLLRGDRPEALAAWVRSGVARKEEYNAKRDGGGRAEALRDFD